MIIAKYGKQEKGYFVVVCCYELREENYTQHYWSFKTVSYLQNAPMPLRDCSHYSQIC